jgi:hypothetical protein
MAKYYVNLVEDKNGNWKQVCSDDYIDMTHYDANLTDEGAIRAFKSKHNIFDEDSEMRERFEKIALRQIKELCALKDNGKDNHSEYLKPLGVTPTMEFQNEIDDYISSILSYLTNNRGWDVEVLDQIINEYKNKEE